MTVGRDAWPRGAAKQPPSAGPPQRRAASTALESPTRTNDAVHRIVAGLAPCPRFSQGLAEDFDVIEIGRVWRFGAAVRLF